MVVGLRVCSVEWGCSICWIFVLCGVGFGFSFVYFCCL